MGYLESSWKFLGIKQRDRPYYVDIIRENKKLPYLPNELWLLIDDALTLMNIEDHARRFMFRFERIQPFKRIFTLPMFDFEDRYPNVTVRISSECVRTQRVVHFHNESVTIVYNSNTSSEYHCRMNLLEATLNGVKVIEDF